MRAEVRHGDCLAVMRTMDAESVDAVICDPPYGLAFIGKDWDHGIPGEVFWREALRVARPGAHLLAFGGTRTSHRLVSAIEDAGWEIRDSLCWIFGSGFPKSHNGTWGGTALKPAHEPICLARKPLIGTVAANVADHGTGALNIDATRIRGVPRTTHADGNRIGNRDGASSYALGREGFAYDGAAGRWPANVCLDEEAARLLDAQSGERKSGGSQHPRSAELGGVFTNHGKNTGRHMARSPDTGGCSRFFYTSKASRREREAGLEGMPESIRPHQYGSIQDGRNGTGTNYSRPPALNVHPTVKPLALMRWLCRLVTPPDGVILDPFCGSGSTGCAAVLEGFRFVGIEQDESYVEISRRRIAHWSATLQPDLESVA